MDSVVLEGLMDDAVPARMADLKVGDKIISIDDIRIHSARDYAVVINAKKPGDVIRISTSRGIFNIILDEDSTWKKARLGLVVKDVPINYWFSVLVNVCSFVVAFVTASGNISGFQGVFGANVLNFADVASTKLFVVFGKFEGNPVAWWLIYKTSFAFAVFIKVFVVLLGTYLLFLAQKSKLSDLPLRLVLLILVFVVVRNVLSVLA